MTQQQQDLQSLCRFLEGHGTRFAVLHDHMVRVGWSSQPTDYWTFWAFPDLHPATPLGGKVELSVIPEYYVPEPARQSMPRLLNVLNWGLSLGNWEMDPADGQLRFRVTVPSAAPLSDDLYAYLLTVAANELRRAMPAILVAGDNGVSPEQAMVFLETDFPADGMPN